MPVFASIVINDFCCYTKTTPYFNKFPNPNPDKVFFRGDLPAKKDVTIRVYNLMGKVVWQKDLEGILELREELDLKGLANGQYLVDVRSLDGGVWREKVLKVGE